MFKRITALLLIALTFASVAACSGDPGNGTNSDGTTLSETTAKSVDETGPKSNVPSGTTFEGREFTMACSDFNQYHHSFVEEMNGDVLNDAIYQMMLDTESALDVKLTEVAQPVHELEKMIASLVLAGDSTYDAVTHLDRYSVKMMLNGSLLPLENAKYIDPSAPHWTPEMTQKLSLGGKSYFAVSSYNLLTLVYTSCYYFNADMLNSFGVESNELYGKVDDGAWTYDALSEYAKLATSDLNGDGVMDASDRYGLSSYDWAVFPSTTIASCDVDVASKDSDNMPVMVWDNEKFSSVSEFTFNLMHGEDAYLKSVRFKADTFNSGNALFMAAHFYAISDLSNMTDDYGIVPPPMLDESQDSYRCATYDAMYTNIPISAKDPEFSGAVLETLSFIGHNSIIDPYIEKTLKDKKSRDERTVDMIQLCIDSRMIDIANVYISDYVGYDKLSSKIFLVDNYALSSFIASNAEKIDSHIEQLVDTMRNQ